jgi:hypothetical protein
MPIPRQRYNGDIGYIASVDLDAGELGVRFDGRTLEVDQLTAS